MMKKSAELPNLEEAGIKLEDLDNDILSEAIYATIP